MIRFYQFLFTIFLSTPVLAFSVPDFHHSMVSTGLNFKLSYAHLQVPLHSDLNIGIKKYINIEKDSSLEFTMHYYTEGISESSWFIGYNFVHNVHSLDVHYPEIGYKTNYDNGFHYTWYVILIPCEIPVFPGFSFGYRL